jgi:hypothetical protein
MNPCVPFFLQLDLTSSWIKKPLPTIKAHLDLLELVVEPRDQSACKRPTMLFVRILLEN